jgi:hypothetical protein
MKITHLLPGLLLLPALAGCEDPSVFIPLQNISGPAGVIEGSVTYIGPAPCTKDGKIIGAAALLAFEEGLLPPPEGLGTTAASLAVVPGEVLFDGMRSQLAFAPDGKTVCGDPGSPVTVSGSWTVGPLPAGTYQIRGFYDIRGDFDPGYSISNLPTKGDVGGGAIDNAAEALAGAAVRYRSIPVGEPGESGALTIPEDGFLVTGVSVSLGLSLPLERPVFHATEVLDESGVNTDPKNVTMASDFQFAEFSTSNPNVTEASFLRMKLTAGLPATPLPKYGNKTEASLATAAPFHIPTKDPFLLYTRQDVNGDGVINNQDHVPDSALLPSLFPLAVFVKLNEGVRIGSQVSPTIVLQGLTIYKSLFNTATAPATLNVPSSEVIVGLRPAVVCIDTNDPAKKGVLLLTHPDDKAGNQLIADEEAEASVKASLFTLFKRDFDVLYGCLPQGDYSMNLVYGTGQAWTVPNEAGVCALSEEAKDNGQTCGSRPRLASQDVLLRVGAPSDGQYCKDHPTPAACLPAPAAE